jgi:hypothetical protein
VSVSLYDTSSFYRLRAKQLDVEPPSALFARRRLHACFHALCSVDPRMTRNCPINASARRKEKSLALTRLKQMLTRILIWPGPGGILTRMCQWNRTANVKHTMSMSMVPPNVDPILCSTSLRTLMDMVEEDSEVGARRQPNRFGPRHGHLV